MKKKNKQDIPQELLIIYNDLFEQVSKDTGLSKDKIAKIAAPNVDMKKLKNKSKYDFNNRLLEWNCEGFLGYKTKK